MHSPQIRIVDQSEAPRTVSVQMMAFSSDPIMRYMWSESHAYVRAFPTFVRGFGGRASSTARRT